MGNSELPNSGAVPYEHAYHLDYGAAAGKYVDAFVRNVDWDQEVTVIPKGGGPSVRVDVDATSGQVLRSGPRAGRDVGSTEHLARGLRDALDHTSTRVGMR